eukprot:TRINITY_DN46870_c0_g1_i1.p1 TRINITY_DN46870_c0_g1~~TRINITY_DN46870_c0_g1_i1.p1  ORF type:complete len:228 (-),score=48.32 TRINITY_DN46870_c0_g1_i1:18-701(-)
MYDAEGNFLGDIDEARTKKRKKKEELLDPFRVGPKVAPIAMTMSPFFTTSTREKYAVQSFGNREGTPPPDHPDKPPPEPKPEDPNAPKVLQNIIMACSYAYDPDLADREALTCGLPIEGAGPSNKETPKLSRAEQQRLYQQQQVAARSGAHRTLAPVAAASEQRDTEKTQELRNWQKEGAKRNKASLLPHERKQFHSKEKRKRDLGLNGDKDFVQEEKRILRQSFDG